MSLLDVIELVAGYGKTPILHGTSLRVEGGETIALFGPNGAGKSTFVKTLFGLLPASAGEIRFDGQSIVGRPAQGMARLGLACVPQEGNTFPSLSVEENLRVAEAGMAERRRSALDEAYALFPILRERRHQRAGTLSGGERQMLAIASAMLARPRLLVLDEPTSGLAPIIVGQLIEQTLAFAAAGTTILWIVGDSAERILPRVSRAYLMQAGTVSGEWAAGAVPDEAAIVELYFGDHHAPGAAEHAS